MQEKNAETSASPVGVDILRRNASGYCYAPVITVVLIVELLRCVLWSDWFFYRLPIYVPGLNIVAATLALRLAPTRRWSVLLALTTALLLGVVSHFFVDLIRGTAPLNDILGSIVAMSFAFSLPITVVAISTTLLVFFLYYPNYDNSINGVDRCWKIGLVWLAATTLSLPFNMNFVGNCAMSPILLVLPALVVVVASISAITLQRKMTRREEWLRRILEGREPDWTIRPRSEFDPDIELRHLYCDDGSHLHVIARITAEYDDGNLGVKGLEPLAFVRKENV